MNLFELVAKLTLDSSEYDRALLAAKGTTAKSGASMVASIEKAKKGMLVATGAMAAGAVAFGASSVKTGMEFDSAMSQVAATMGKTMDEMASETGTVELAWGSFTGNLRDYAKEMGANTKFSATQAAEALNYMALAGYDTQKSMEMLPPVLNLAAAGNMELATASDMVTDASSALSLTQEQTVQMVDQMAAAASKSNTSVEQLGSAFLTVGGTAKVLQGGTTELSTALGILADNGTKGAEGGTALRNILTAIQGDKFEDTFGEMGISAYDAEGNLRSLKDVFLDMNEAMQGFTDEEKTDIINATFNARDLKNVNALLGTSAQRWDELSGSIEDSEGAAQQMADTQLDNLEGDITLLKSAFEGLQISVGEKLMPYIREFIQGLTWCIDHMDTLGPIILGVATAFGILAIALNIGTIIQSVAKAFGVLNAIMMMNPFVLIAALIAGVVVALIALWKNNEAFRNKVKAIWDGIKTAVSNAVNAVKTAVSNAWNAVKSRTMALWNAVKTAVVSRATAIVSGVQSKFNALKAKVSAIWNGIKTAITSKIEAAKNKVKSVIDTIKGFFPLKIGKIFSGLKLPHFSVSGGSAPFGIGGKGSLPKFSVSWYKRAEQLPYLFNNATIFGAGEHTDEMLYGKSALMNDIETAVANVNGRGGSGAQAVAMGEVIGEIVAEAIEGMEIILDRRQVGKFTRRAVRA